MKILFESNINIPGTAKLPDVNIDMTATGQGSANGIIAGKALLETLYKMVPESRPPFGYDLGKWSVNDLKAEMDRILTFLPDEKARRRAMHKIRREIERHERKIRTEQGAFTETKERILSAVDAVEKLIEWSSGPIKLQKPQGSMLATFVADVAERRAFHFFNPKVPNRATKMEAAGTLTEVEAAEWSEMAEQASDYLVEHDWAAAFANATDYAGGELRLPDDICAFEFRLMDRHVIAFATDADGVLYTQMALQVRKGWVLFNVADDRHGDGIFSAICAAVFAQIKAISVALDAEVAVAQVIRQAHRSNRERQHHNLPLYSFHVIRLARKTRAEPLESDALTDGSEKRHRRLHFRRGHWRHYEAHKTWIKWMLVGDPSLGFIEKEYRL